MRLRPETRRQVFREGGTVQGLRIEPSGMMVLLKNAPVKIVPLVVAPVKFASVKSVELKFAESSVALANDLIG